MTDDRWLEKQDCVEELQAYNGWCWQDALHYVQGHTLYSYLYKVIEYYYQQANHALVKVKIANVPDSDKESEVSSLKAQTWSF